MAYPGRTHSGTSGACANGLVHHAGHGIGTRMHESPNLNRDREGILRVGDVACVEPGGYTAEARCGVRIENTYLITESGSENSSEYPVNILRAEHSSSAKKYSTEDHVKLTE